MINKTDLDEIEKEIRGFFEKMTIIFEIDPLSQKDETLNVNLRAEEPQFLIGERGQTLQEIQHILKIILKRKIPEIIFLNLDINDYKKKKNNYLTELAKSVADEVVLSKKEKILPPMPAYERRIIHLELAERKNVTSESIGQEPERRVVIKPYP
jgi:spoIIIJ-associated protein